MKRTDTKSHCPINFALETFGDMWSLLIVRDIINYQKTTYGEFLDSEEKISTNILADRLARLEESGIIRKEKSATDKRKDQYTLTQKGIDLYPMMIEMALWSAKYDPKTIVTEEFVARAREDREELIREQQERAKNIVKV
jgi:DNA-binding HxlR family transcriptional regulator